MIKPVNLLSIKNARESLPTDVFNSYLNKSGVVAKKDEIDDLCSFVDYVYSSSSDIHLFDSFYFGYTIQQISKEFDLLRFGENFLINIEIKRKQTVEKIKKQLIQNQYYLRFLGKKVINFTYISEENKIYLLTDEQEITEVKLEDSVKLFSMQEIINIEEIDKLFRPTNYLVSPFNSTELFIEGKYFLTQQQNEIKKEIIGKLNTELNCYGIEGVAGTGKTLLTYDIAKHFINEKKRVLIVHCGNLNIGHNKLINDYSWEIYAAKNLKKIELDSYDLIIVDETQRIWPEQFQLIVNAIIDSKVLCIFSYDPNQCLADFEINRNIPLKIQEQLSPKIFKLTGKIRTNPEVASFIKSLFEPSKVNVKYDYTNIDIQYFTNYHDAGNFAILLKEKNWNILSYTESNYNHREADKFTAYSNLNAHAVVGQEFDKIATVIDSSFRYNKDKRLVSLGKSYYNPGKMLFQMLTRAREKICLIIVNNEEMLKECLAIQNYYNSISLKEYGK